MTFAQDALRGRVAIVTGGGTGIGRAIARAYARLGADVVIASRRAEHLDPAAAELRALGARALAVPTDIRQREQVEALLDRTLAEFGRVDILVNNAAGLFHAPALDISPNGWATVVNIILNGTWHCTQTVGRQMIRQGDGGAIINILGSITTFMGYYHGAHAGAAKAGVWNLTQTLAVEWAPHRIRVNAIAPGHIATEQADAQLRSDPAAAQRQVAGIPLGRVGDPEEIAAAAVFLASDAASYVTGIALRVDGGEALARPE